MNKLLLSISLFFTIKFYSQVTKQDFEFILSQKPYSEIEHIYYSQGVKGDVKGIGGEIKQRYDVWNVKASKEKCELRDNAMKIKI